MGTKVLAAASYGMYKLSEMYRDEYLNKKYWPYHVSIEYEHKLEAIKWCYANFKSRNWRNAESYFAFKRAEDCMMFTLRWS
jgi:hypothetical protein